MSHEYRHDTSGQGLVEYAILIATVSLGLILLLGTYRYALGNLYRDSKATIGASSSVEQAGVGPLPTLPPSGGGGGGSVGGGPDPCEEPGGAGDQGGDGGCGDDDGNGDGDEEDGDDKEDGDKDEGGNDDKGNNAASAGD